MIIEKTGGGAGYTTYIALNPARHIGIFVAATEDRMQDLRFSARATIC